MENEALRTQILEQQRERFPDRGPALHGLGTALFRITPDDRRAYHANVVSFVQTTPEAAPEFIKRITQYYSTLAPELLWQIDDVDCSTFNIIPYLEQQGFTLYEDLHAMVHEGTISSPENPHITVRRVVNRSDMAQYELIASTVFGGRDTPPSRAELEAAAERRWRLMLSGWTRYFLGYYDNQPVGTTAVTDETIPLVQSVATLKQARGRGVATAMVAHAVNYTCSMGYDTTSLYVNRDSPAERIYRRLGYIPLFTEKIYRIEFDEQK